MPNTELRPFDDVSFEIAIVKSTIVFNLVYPDISDGAYIVHGIEQPERESKCFSWPLGWDGAEGISRCAELIIRHRIKALHIVSPVSFARLLQSAITKQKGEKKRKPRGGKKPKPKRTREEPQGRFYSKVVQRGSRDGIYKLEARFQISPIRSSTTKGVFSPFVSCALFAARGSERRKEYRSFRESGFEMELALQASTQDALLQYIEEEMAEWQSKSVLTHSAIIDACHKIYLDPLACLAIYDSGERWPTAEWIEKDKEKFNEAIDIYSAHFHEVFRHCAYTVYIPPMPSELSFRFLTRLEIAFLPDLLDVECFIERKSGGSDALFDKLLQHLPAEAKESNAAINFTYGALLDLGQIFNYGECAAIAARVHLINP